METKVRKIVLISVAIVSLLSVGLLWKFIYYGSVTRSCIYTEEILPVPENLARGEITVSKDAYRASGQEDGYQCLPSMGKIAWELVTPEVINNVTVGARYFTEQGRSLEGVHAGSRFHVVGVVTIYKHGITTMDSGGGGIDFLILEDTKGNRYSLATVNISLNEGDEFLDFVSSAGTSHLGFENFRLGPAKPFTFTESPLVSSVGTMITDNDKALLVKPDYDALRKNCDSSCCVSSIEYMRENGYPLFQGKCPAGYKEDRMKCIQSFTWCEPI